MILNWLEDLNNELTNKMTFIRNTYIPEIVKTVISKQKPETEGEFIEFAQALYDQVKIKEDSIKSFQN